MFRIENMLFSIYDKSILSVTILIFCLTISTCSTPKKNIEEIYPNILDTQPKISYDSNVIIETITNKPTIKKHNEKR